MRISDWSSDVCSSDLVVDAKHHVRIHLDETAIAVPGETGIARRRRKPLDRLVVEAQVQHRVHHAGHGYARAGAHRHQKRDRKSGGEGKSVSVRVDLGGRRIIKKKKQQSQQESMKPTMKNTEETTK